MHVERVNRYFNQEYQFLLKLQYNLVTQWRLINERNIGRYTQIEDTFIPLNANHNDSHKI